MATINDPRGAGTIDVRVVDEESHFGNEMVQVEATDESLELTDESGESPWFFRDEVYGA